MDRVGDEILFTPPEVRLLKLGGALPVELIPVATEQLITYADLCVDGGAALLTNRNTELHEHGQFLLGMAELVHAKAEELEGFADGTRLSE